MNLNRLLDPLRRRVATLISRAVLGGVNAQPGCQTLQVTILADEPQTGVEHLEPYGFTSNPLAGSEGVILNVAGQRGAAIGINFGDRRVRVAGLKPGEVCVYTDEGDKIHLMRERHMRLETLHLEIMAQEDATVETKLYTVKASQGVRYETPAFALGGEGGCSAAINANMAIQGDTTQTGVITATGDVQGQGVSLAGHTHPGDSGGTTGEPL